MDARPRTDLELVFGGEPPNRREVEVLQHAAAGLNVNETAGRLFLAPDTVKGYRKRVIAKLRTKNMVHAVAEGLRQGLIT